MNGGLMRVFNNRNIKKNGFSLMELAIAVMIVALLTIVCIPIVKNQLSKSDEYAYYMAYRSVEKLGGQIVALGDPKDPRYKKTSEIPDTSKIANVTNIAKNSWSKNIKSVFTNLSLRFAYTEHFVFKNLFPKSFADEPEWYDGSSISSIEYENVQRAYLVCQMGKFIQKGTDENGNPVKYECEDVLGSIDNGDNTTSSVSKDDYFKDFAPVKGLIPSQGFLNLTKPSSDNETENDAYGSALKSQYRELENYIKNGGDFAGYCAKLHNYCSGKVDNNTVEYESKKDLRVIREEADDEDDASEYSSCDSRFRYLGSSSSEVNNSTSYTRPPVKNICVNSPYFGMYNAGGTYALSCECQSGKFVTSNDDKVCCSHKDNYNSYAPVTKTEAKTNIFNAYARAHSGLAHDADAHINYCRYCSGEYNSVSDWCCPEHSFFNGTACECASGYEMDRNKGTSSEKCELKGCADGYRPDFKTQVCIPNPPIVKASRFCELIKEYWNIVPNSDNCNLFTEENNVNVYKNVLEAAKGNNGSGYLSINSKQGAFANLRPNIILSNGLRLWILGDKSASIPGLSYNPVGISSTQNMCRELLKSDNISPLSTRELCDAAGGYFCAGESHCYTLDSAASLNKMGDARNCCASTDLSTIDYSADVDKDNRSFAIGGFTVFVDINGTKGSGTLWEDVFPFYVGTNGKVYPGYPLDAPKSLDADSNSVYLAGNSVKNIPVDVYYFTSSGDSARRRVVAYSNVSYARGVCFAKLVNSHTPYCKNLGLKAKGAGTQVDKGTEAIDSASNPCSSHSCFVSVRNKLRFF